MGFIKGSLSLALIIIFVISFSGALVLYSFSNLTEYETYKESLEKNNFYGEISQPDIIGEIRIEISEETVEEIIDENIKESLDYINGESEDLDLVVEFEREDLERIIQNDLDDKEICLENQNYLFNGEIICKPQSFTAEEVAGLYLNRQGISENETYVVDVGENLGLAKVAEEAKGLKDISVRAFYILIIVALGTIVSVFVINFGDVKNTTRTTSYALLISGFLTFGLGYIFYKFFQMLSTDGAGAFKLFSNLISDVLSSTFLNLGYTSLFVVVVGLALLAISIVIKKN